MGAGEDLPLSSSTAAALGFIKNATSASVICIRGLRRCTNEHELVWTCLVFPALDWDVEKFHEVAQASHMVNALSELLSLTLLPISNFTFSHKKGEWAYLLAGLEFKSTEITDRSFSLRSLHPHHTLHPISLLRF